MYIENNNEEVLKELLSKYSDRDINYVNDYHINGSVIKVEYCFNPNYEWDTKKQYTHESETVEINLLDYINYLHNRKQ